MKNNRQIGLNGRIFVSGCLKRGTVFVFLLMLGGIATAVADILKLAGASGAIMSTFSTTLLLYDFVCSLMLVIVVFYAYFLECGDGVPVLRHKPLIVFGCARLGYLILLAYYICYRALYCMCGMNSASPTLCIFYFVYFIFIFLCILANCFVYNILTRNIVRRSYIKSFHALSSVGLVVQILLPVMYIIARVTMKDVGDEFFTTAVCDLIRLCLCPLCTTGVWLLFVNAIGQVSDVFNEVDTALRERRYQITYTSPDDDKKGKELGSGKKKSGYTSTAFLPAPNKTAPSLAGAGTAQKKALPAARMPAQAGVQENPGNSGEKPAEIPAGTPSPVKKKLPPKQPSAEPAPAVKQTAPARTPAVVKTPAAAKAPDRSEHPKFVQAPIVQEFNPYPEAAAPPAGSGKSTAAGTGQKADRVQAQRRAVPQPQKKPANIRPAASAKPSGSQSSANSGIQNNYRGKKTGSAPMNQPKRGGKK